MVAQVAHISDPPAPRPGRVPSPSQVDRARERSLPPEERRLAMPRERTPLETLLRLVRRHGLTLLGIAFSLAHLAGLYGLRANVPAWSVAAPLAIIVALAVAWRLRKTMRGERVVVRFELALGLLLSDLAFAVVQLTGDRRSHMHAIVYLLAAFFAVAPLPRRAALGLVLVVVLQNVLRYVCADALLSEWPSLVVQVGFTATFALLYHLLLSSRLWAARTSEEEAVSRRLREAEESARSLRLVIADRSRDRRRGADEEQFAQRLLLGAVLEVERGVGSIIEGAHLALGGHALALYWLSEDEATLSLRDGRCAAGLLSKGPLGAGDGLLGTVLRHGLSVRHAGKFAGVNWYDRGVAVRAVVAVPVLERAVDGTGYVRGAIVVDRLEAEPFSDRDVKFLEEAAAQIARAVEAERLVAELHQSKDAQDRLTRAAEELNRAATVEEVARAAARLARDLAPGLDLAAITRVEGEGGERTHIVVAAEGPRATEVDGLVYDDNDGLVAHVVRLGAPLPPRPPGVLERVKLFDLKLAGFGSVRVLPLAAGGRVLGSLAVGGKGRFALEPDARRRLESLAALTAGALARALALAEISLLATTDGLTGLVNRRQLDILSSRAFLEASRYERPLAVLVTDVDHFKKVNDTHGHAAGDEVLRSIAAVLKEEARGTDVVGRYGGEEFVLCCPNTDTEGAKELAERIRRRVEASAVETSAGPISVTLSLGVAAFPIHGASLDALVHAGDEALYAAKRAGRNRVVLAGAELLTSPRRGAS